MCSNIRPYNNKRLTMKCIFVITANLNKRDIQVDEDDVKGAAAGIVRVFSEYRCSYGHKYHSGAF